MSHASSHLFPGSLLHSEWERRSRHSRSESSYTAFVSTLTKPMKVLTRVTSHIHQLSWCWAESWARVSCPHLTFITTLPPPRSELCLADFSKDAFLGTLPFELKWKGYLKKKKVISLCYRGREWTGLIFIESNSRKFCINPIVYPKKAESASREQFKEFSDMFHKVIPTFLFTFEVLVYIKDIF